MRFLDTDQWVWNGEEWVLKPQLLNSHGIVSVKDVKGLSRQEAGNIGIITTKFEKKENVVELLLGDGSRIYCWGTLEGWRIKLDAG